VEVCRRRGESELAERAGDASRRGGGRVREREEGDGQAGDANGRGKRNGRCRGESSQTSRRGAAKYSTSKMGGDRGSEAPAQLVHARASPSLWMSFSDGLREDTSDTVRVYLS